MPTRVVLRVAITTMLLLAGCMRAPGGPPASDTSWTMESIDGAPLPIVNEFEHRTWGACRVEVRSGSLALTADHRYRLETLRKIDCERDGESTVAQEEPEWMEGAYTLEGQQLTLMISGPDLEEMGFSGVMTGDHVLIQMDDNEIRFARNR